MEAPWPWTFTVLTAPMKSKSSIFVTCPSKVMYYYCKRSPVNDSSPRPCTVCTQNSDSPHPKPIKSAASSSKSVIPGDCVGNEIILVSSAPIRRHNSGIFPLLSFFDKDSLWQRISSTSKKVRSIISLNIVTIVYASSIPVVKEVEELVDPAAFNVVRFAITAIPFIPFVLYKWDDAQS